MKSLKQYSISFRGLKNGFHQFDFKIEDNFFAEFEYSLVKHATVNLSLKLEKKENMLILDLTLDGEITLDCDKCLANYSQQISTTDRQIARYMDEVESDVDDELIIIKKNDQEIDLTNIIYELVNVSVPYIKVCENPGNTPACDKAMIEKLAVFTAAEEEDKSNDIADPRWEALKNLKNN